MASINYILNLCDRRNRNVLAVLVKNNENRLAYGCYLCDGEFFTERSFEVHVIQMHQTPNTTNNNISGQVASVQPQVTTNNTLSGQVPSVQPKVTTNNTISRQATSGSQQASTNNSFSNQLATTDPRISTNNKTSLQPLTNQLKIVKQKPIRRTNPESTDDSTTDDEDGDKEDPKTNGRDSGGSSAVQTKHRPSERKATTSQVKSERTYLLCNCKEKVLENEMNVHRQVCKKVWPSLRCPICKQVFSKSTARHQHVLREHASEVPYGCKKCPYRFQNREELQVHLRKQHSNGKVIPCPQCGKNLSTVYELKEHVNKRHTRNA